MWGLKPLEPYANGCVQMGVGAEVCPAEPQGVKGVCVCERFGGVSSL